MSKIIKLNTEARKNLWEGIKELSDAVMSTLGPNGRNMMFITEEGLVGSTKDGVSVAKEIILKDPIANLGVQALKQTAIKTAEKAGDGTTTSTLLARFIIEEGLHYVNKGCNVVEIKKGIERATKQVIEFLRNNISQEIKSADQIQQIATISSNNDEEIGNIIVMAMDYAGREGIVTIEESKTEETYLEKVEGVQFERGYKSHYFVTNNGDMTCHLEDPYILLVDENINQIKDLLPLLEQISSQNKSLLIIANDIDNEALATLIVNKGRGNLKVCAVKAPDFGERRKLLMEDIAIITGGEVVSKERGMKLKEFSWDWLGRARNINITKDKTTIIDGRGESESIQTRIEELQQQIEKSKTPFETEKIQERLAKLAGGIVIIHVGGYTESEIREKKDRVEDSLNATQAALEEGVVSGGGIALLFARDYISKTREELDSDIHIGKEIVYKACSKPFFQILKNAGFEIEDISSAIAEIIKRGEGGTEPWWGVDLKKNEIVNLIEVGVIDPTKVVRLALENASSVAAGILITEVVVVDDPEVKKENSNPFGGMF